MQILKTQTVEILNESDIVVVRKLVREWTLEAKFSLINQTKLMTAASELARNVFKYAATGTVQLNLMANPAGRTGLQLIFEDQGPGIPDIDQAMRDGFSTGNSLGIGLSGSQRLVHDFEITSQEGKGTRAAIVIWK
jgi:serine/threonine-protein kinase RsbT